MLGERPLSLSSLDVLRSLLAEKSLTTLALGAAYVHVGAPLKAMASDAVAAGIVVALTNATIKVPKQALQLKQVYSDVFMVIIWQQALKRVKFTKHLIVIESLRRVRSQSTTTQQRPQQVDVVAHGKIRWARAVNAKSRDCEPALSVTP